MMLSWSNGICRVTGMELEEERREKRDKASVDIESQQKQGLGWLGIGGGVAVIRSRLTALYVGRYHKY